MTAHQEPSAADDRWHQHYFNAAEALFGKLDGDQLDEHEDAACIAYADDAFSADCIGLELPEPGDQPAEDWLAMAPGLFDTAAPPVQLALFPEPDAMGTPDMFGGAE